jgi:hypothetical protein
MRITIEKEKFEDIYPTQRNKIDLLPKNARVFLDEIIFLDEKKMNSNDNESSWLRCLITEVHYTQNSTLICFDIIQRYPKLKLSKT